MKKYSRTRRWGLLAGACLLALCPLHAQGLPTDSLSAQPETVAPRRYTHRIGVEARPAYIFPTRSFLEGNNYKGKQVASALSAHLEYSFQPASGSLEDRIYGGAYQGIGVAHFRLGESEMLGDPTAVYLFQGARLAQLAPRLSLDYEWNFGLSFGWHPYDPDRNPDNSVIGSRVNAYLNAGCHLTWALAPHLDLRAGLTLTHFSNGNTKIPNCGLNTVAAQVGLAYVFRREEDAGALACPPPVPRFPRHISYDLVLFGSWRRTGVAVDDVYVAAPDRYPVLGFNFSPMYNFGYRLRAGLSLDGVYDSSANVYVEDYIVSVGGGGDSYVEHVCRPPLRNQLALGVSGRVEYVMPYFTIGAGIGANVLHGGGSLEGCYQVLALKIGMTRNSFLHIGYNLQNFHDPNYLMLGVGYRFGNRAPR